MNRSILIVICDFLLISLLAFNNADMDKTPDTSPTQARGDVATNAPAITTGKQDLGEVMRLALNEERKNREQLTSELAKSREDAARQMALLGEREKQVLTVQQELQSRNQEAARLQEQQASLLQQFSVAQTNIATLNQKLQSASAETMISKENLAAIQAEARKQQEQSAALQQQLAQLARSNQIVQSEKEQLNSQLLLAESERRSATELAARMQDEVKVEREEKAKLAEGVKALASRSGELAQEIRENRPLAANTIFNDFISNRVDAHFEAVRPVIFGIDSNRKRDSQTILATDGKHIFAVAHVQDTPFTLWVPGTDWEGLTGTFSHNLVTLPIASLSFYQMDPRIVLIPVADAQAKQFGAKIYHISTDPYKFQDVVVVGTRDNYYGECKFEIDASSPEYVRMDRNSLKGLFGKFNPSRGDLVFTKTGDLLGIMANSTYCMLVQNFDAGSTFVFGKDVPNQHTGAVLSSLAQLVQQMPFKLQ